MAMACFGFLTFWPLRPDLSLPFFMAFISVSTLLPAAGEYLRPEDFFPELFFAEDFFALLVLPLLLFFALAPRLEELLFLALLDFFFVAFFVAINYSPLKIRCSADYCQLYRRCASMMLCGWSSCQIMRVALHDASPARHAHQRISNQPAGNACERTRQAELHKRGRDKGVEQKSDPDEYGRVNDVHSIGTAIQP